MLQMPIDAYFKLDRVQVKPWTNKKRRGVGVPVPHISQAPRQNADAEAIQGACRFSWWLQITFDAYFKLARVQVKPGTNYKVRAVGVPVPQISQTPRQNADAEAIQGACRPPWWLQIPFDAYLKLSRVQVKPGTN